MKIPLITSDASLRHAVQGVLDAVNRRAGQGPGEPLGPFELVTWDDAEQAREAIDYEMPPLLLLNFSASGLDAFALMQHLLADRWLRYGSIIALYADSATRTRLDAMVGSNVIVHLAHHDIERQLGTVLEVIRSNRQILYQRALQNNLLASVSGEFVLQPDLPLVPVCANLVANYLFNVGFLDAEAKTGVSLALTEMLVNAIEHGNCGITFEEKRAVLAGRRSIQDVITAKCGDPAVRGRRVRYRYDIGRERSVHVICDEGRGFDWRRHIGAEPADPLAESGRGILLARRLATHVDYNEAGNEVTLEFRHTTGGAAIPGALRDNEMLECAPGDVIFNQGEASDYLYYVAAGEFQVVANGHQVATLTPADMLMGEMSLLLEETRSATVIARTPGRLIRISKQDFIDIVKREPYYGLFLARLMARRLYRLSHGVL